MTESVADRPLTTWKQIAHHLGVDIRTAQRWERERGLAVRRLPGKGGRVAITTADIQRWQAAAKHGSSTRHHDVVCYRWPLSKTTLAELRVTGAPLTREHLERLQSYLDLVKAALTE